MTSRNDVTTYNNFYEFGVDKADSAAKAHALATKPWTVAIDGLVERSAKYLLEDILKAAPLDERI